VVKIIDDTQAELDVLSYLSRELFEEVSKRNEEDLKNQYGKEAGTLLVDEAYCESIFETTNCVDSQKMEKWDSELFSGE